VKNSPLAQCKVIEHQCNLESMQFEPVFLSVFFFFFVLQIQHEVTHLGAIHKLCSDECFARFRSSRNLYMSYCENCGNCTASGNYHLVQIEDSIKKFCCTECISNYKQVPQH